MAWVLWGLRYWFLGYRMVDKGTEVDREQALERAKDTAVRYARGRSIAIKVDNEAWAVMVQGWSRRKEDG